MTAAEIRQSFFDFFHDRGHTIVPSASLLPQSPGLLFTNAGMNQFVPYFLGTEPAPYNPPRAADTQKCIRAGGKHNDLEDVGYDTYHHTFFEMLGNWSFGDYFKKEAIGWAWELLVGRWGVPAGRLFATVYAPDKAKGDPGEFDHEAYACWEGLFRAAGLDPAVHIVHGNVKDNFWMMGDTGPCGPCSELHIDLTPHGDTRGALVNAGSDQCIEIWNLVFIQFNAEADGSFRDLPSRHVDTGMGFERVCSIIQGTDGFRDFSRRISNYNTDVFLPVIARLAALSGRSYRDLYPADRTSALRSDDPALADAIAFRVIADHARTLVFSIADGILPGNNGRNYVLRRILRRAVRYGRRLGFSGRAAFLPELVATLCDSFGAVFPELPARAAVVRETLAREENAFNETLDRGLELFEAEAARAGGGLSGEFAFKLYDTFGFPPDLTRLLCDERGLGLDMERFEALMEEQRERARAARASAVVRALDLATNASTTFTGDLGDADRARVLEVHRQDDLAFVITDRTPFYAEMGGQAGDTGWLAGADGIEHVVAGVQQIGKARAHLVEAAAAPAAGDEVELRVDPARRRPIEAHHTATHLLHWALHEVVGCDAVQQGSLVEPDRLRFDFSAGPVAAAELAEIERRVNEAVQADHPVGATEVVHATIKGRRDIMQFFGDKYGETVRVVQIGGEPGALDGFSMELCGGTHVPRTGAIGLFKIKSEGAIAAGVRRIEASCGEAAWEHLGQMADKLRDEAAAAADRLAAANARLHAHGEKPLEVSQMPHIMPALLAAGDISVLNGTLEMARAKVAELKAAAAEADKLARKLESANAARAAEATLAGWLAGHPAGLARRFDGDPALLQELVNGLKKHRFGGAAVVVCDDGEKLHLAVWCGADAAAAGRKAGELLRELAALGGGKGGGGPEFARGVVPGRDALAAILAAASAAVEAPPR
jgi:alanyl-tRNA synthetase